MYAAALGWLGMGGTFAAYLLLAQGRLGAESLGYALLNALGGILGGIASVIYGAWPSVASNVVWATIGLHSVAMAVQRRTRVAADHPASAWDPLPATLELPVLDGTQDCLV
jgi:hypothetical protein